MATVAAPVAPALTVADCLRLEPLGAARVVAGTAGLARKAVAWVAVIEWPVEDFVAPGELVLSTGVGCDEAMFEQLAREVAASGAAALCVGVGDRAPFPCVPPGVVALGDAEGFPVIALNWEVRFADVSRMVIDRLLAAKYRTARTTGRLAPQFTEALLRRDGMAAIAEALERTLGRPAVVLDGGLTPVAMGAAARAQLGEQALAAGQARALELDAPSRRALQAALAVEPGEPVATLEALGLPVAVAAPACAEGATVGYVLSLVGEAEAPLLSVERAALEQAATAVAIEALRRQAAVEAEARAEGDFLWQLAAVVPRDRAVLAARASLLGHDLDRRCALLLADVGDGLAEPERDRLLNDLRAEALRLGAAAGVRAARRGGELLVVVPEGAPPGLAPSALAERLVGAVDGGAPVSWGIAPEVVPLLGLADAVRGARRAIAVGRSLRGEGHVFDAQALAPFLMLASVAADRDARAATRAVLEPILRYDAATSRQLLRTLEVYLEENGNTSSAARRLHLNRHSLLYRLRKIETLTGRELARYEDRFLFELSLRLERFADA